MTRLRYTPLLTALLCALAAACSPTAKRVSNPEIGAGIRPVSAQLCPPLSAVHMTEVQTSRPAIIAPEKLEGDRLVVIADYVGGCSTHEFKICASEFLDASPVQVQLEAIHKSDDRCENRVRERMSIDLTFLKDSYRRTYRKEAGAILLGLPNGEMLYQFGR